ncbi:MAG TPA: hypothetical protein VGO39_12005 [Gaiellaceae bacterium]|jgi:hypothetical protein|nr:hypothetical protein [Gaiellaceae bacterium]
MNIRTILPLLAAGAVTVLAVAGLSNAASSAAPVNTVEPKISGTAQEGQTLSATSGTWTSSTTPSYAYQWRRCDTQGNGCANIGGADTSTYLVRSADVGNTLRVRVTAKNADGSTQASSNETAVVKAKSPAPPVLVNGCPAAGTGPLDVSQITPPARLVVDGQVAAPSPITRTVTDLQLRFHVSACNGRSIGNALVYATAIPFQQFSVPAEVATDATGWATLTLHRGVAFPASPRQQILAVFSRARKSGDSPLGGVTGSRLVSFRVHL